MFDWQRLVETPVSTVAHAGSSQALASSAVDVLVAAALVADDLVAFDADQRRDIAELAQLAPPLRR